MFNRVEEFVRVDNGLKGFVLKKLIILFHVVCFFIVCPLDAAFSRPQLFDDVSDDVVKVEVIRGEIVGINTSTNLRVVEKLERGETVTSALSKGMVGAVLTDRRILGFNATNNSWSSFETFFSSDVFPNEIKVSSTMAVAIAERRVYAYTFTSNKWEFELVSFLEQTVSSDINDNLIFIRTSSRLLGFSFVKQKWFSQNLYAIEAIKYAAVGENFVTVTTGQRILTFNAKYGAWTVEFIRPDSEKQSTNLTAPPSGPHSGNAPVNDKS